MKKYLPILLLWACNNSSEKASPIVVTDQTFPDSISLIVDSLKEWSENISDISSYAIKAEARIKQLEKEKAQEEERMPVYMDAIQYLPADKKDEEVRKLTEKVLAYEREIKRLRAVISRDSVIRTRKPVKADYVVQEPEKPNEKSLVVTLEGTEPGASIWIMESNRKSKKLMKGYYNCQLKDLNLLGAIQAKFYQGVYFFNDLPTGKYIVKVCALYGDWLEVKRQDGYQTVAMKVAPPIQ